MYIVIAIVIFGVLITVHELGHFTAAKLCGVKVSEFAIGMGPALFKRQGAETLYSLRALPIGGYCAMEEDEESDDPRHFSQKSWWKRLIILMAGSAMNILAGYVIMLFVVPGTSYMPEGSGFFEVFRAAWVASVDLGKLVWLGLSQLVSGQVGLGDLSGPVGIVGIISEVGSSAGNAAQAAQMIARLAAFIAINLGIMNLLPIPALDGGRILFLLVNTVVEKITKRKLNPKYEGYIHAAGMILLLGLMAVVMFSDIYKLFV